MNAASSAVKMSKTVRPRRSRREIFDHAFERPIHQNISARRRILHDDGYRNIFDDGIEELLGLAQRFFGAALLGDIDMRSDPASFGHRLMAYGIYFPISELV